METLFKTSADKVFLSTPSARRATGIEDLLPLPWNKFLSTPSARRATWGRLLVPDVGLISIHALREEGDPRLMVGIIPSNYFYPRPPRGGRPVRVPHLPAGRDFYPRPPRGGRPSADF